MQERVRETKQNLELLFVSMHLPLFRCPKTLKSLSTFFIHWRVIMASDIFKLSLYLSFAYSLSFFTCSGNVNIDAVMELPYWVPDFISWDHCWSPWTSWEELSSESEVTFSPTGSGSEGLFQALNLQVMQKCSSTVGQYACQINPSLDKHLWKGKKKKKRLTCSSCMGIVIGLLDQW